LKYTFCIGPRGELYKCFGVVGDKRYSIGNITSPLKKIETEANRWVNIQAFDKECVSCNFFPLCRGSMCQHASAQFHNGEFGHKFCEKSYILRYLENTLKAGLFGQYL